MSKAILRLRISPQCQFAVSQPYYDDSSSGCVSARRMVPHRSSRLDYQIRHFTDHDIRAVLRERHPRLTAAAYFIAAKRSHIRFTFANNSATMSVPAPDPNWVRSDRYHNSFLLRPDEALEHALKTSDEHGLPKIAVSPAQGKLLYLVAKSINAKRVLEVGTLGG